MRSKIRWISVLATSVFVALTGAVAPAGVASAAELPPPGDFRVTASGFDSISLAWTRVPDAEFYRVLVDGVLRSGTYDPSSDVTVTQLEPGVEYRFEVQAQSTGGDFGPSATLHASTLADTEPPTAPTGLREARDANGRSIGLTWNPSTDNWGVHGGYTIYADGRRAMIGGAPTEWYWLTDPYHGGLACGTTYEFTVQATDKNNNKSAHSAPLTATTPGC